MAYAANKESPEGATKKKRSPLAGLFGRSGEKQNPDESLPAMDIEGGLGRALRLASNAPVPHREDQSSHHDNVREALTSIEGALFTIDRVRDYIEQAYEVALSAQEVEDVGGRALLAESYDELRLSINAAIDAVEDRAATLVGKSQRQVDVRLGGKAHYSISPVRLDISARGLNINPPREAFATFEEITTALEELDSALKKADRAAAGYCRDAQFLMQRISAFEQNDVEAD